MDEASSKNDSELSGGNTASSTTEDFEKSSIKPSPDMSSDENLDGRESKETLREASTRQSIDNENTESIIQNLSGELNPQAANLLYQVSTTKLVEGNGETLRKDETSTTEKQTSDIERTEINEYSSLGNQAETERQQEGSYIDIELADLSKPSIKEGSSKILNVNVAKKKIYEKGRLEQKESLIKEQNKFIQDSNECNRLSNEVGSNASEIREESSLDPVAETMTDKTFKDGESVELDLGSSGPVELQAILDKNNELSSDNKSGDLETAELGKTAEFGKRVQEETDQAILDNSTSSLRNNKVSDLKIKEGNKPSEEGSVMGKAEEEDVVSVERLNQTKLDERKCDSSSNENVKLNINNESNLGLIESDPEERLKDKQRNQHEKNLTPQSTQSTLGNKKVWGSKPIEHLQHGDAMQIPEDDSSLQTMNSGSLKDKQDEKEDILKVVSQTKSKKLHSGTAGSEDYLTKSDDFQCEENPKERALRYLEESGVLRMFQSLAAGIVQDRPEKPLLYMIDYLERENQTE